MTGRHVDDWYPVDGPSRNGRMVWPPYVGEHRAETVVIDFPPPTADAVITGWTTKPFEVRIGVDDARIQATRALDAQVHDVWSGNPDTDKWWARNEEVPNFYD